MPIDVRRTSRPVKAALLGTLVLICAWALAGCRSAADHRKQADKAAYGIISQKQKQAMGRTEDLRIEQPSETFRRRLMIDQHLAYASKESLGTDQLDPIAHWPEKDYPKTKTSHAQTKDPNQPIKLSMMQTLQVGARNSLDYQTRKENVFRAALDLELERDAFRNTFLGQLKSLVSVNAGGEGTVSGMRNSGTLGVDRTLPNGEQVSSALAIDLASLLAGGTGSALGLSADASVSIPLLRGSGRQIVMEPLTQAERNVIYALYEFETYKRAFAVNIASNYLAVLRAMDGWVNAEQNYRSVVSSARRSRRLADAGRISAIQVDQAVQSELEARNGWLSAGQSYEGRMDSFKSLLGLPPDARIQLDRTDLERLRAPAEKLLDQWSKPDPNRPTAPPADAPIELVKPDNRDAGPLEMEEDKALKLAFDNRLDLRVRLGTVYDAQRGVVVEADRLRAELTLLGSVGYGGRVSSGDSENARLRLDKGDYSGLLTLNLPLERTAEQNAYRKSYIDLERAIRDMQALEDEVKLAIRDELRALLEARETLKIQAQSVVVADKRVRSSNLFLEAGRIEIRDLLDAQRALLSAQNALTGAVVDYRVTELSLQRDMGVLDVNENGLWKEYVPEVTRRVADKDNSPRLEG